MISPSGCPGKLTALVALPAISPASALVDCKPDKFCLRMRSTSLSGKLALYKTSVMSSRPLSRCLVRQLKFILVAPADKLAPIKSISRSSWSLLRVWVPDISKEPAKSASPALLPSSFGLLPILRSIETFGILWFSDKITVMPLVVVNTCEAGILIFWAAAAAGLCDRSNCAKTPLVRINIRRRYRLFMRLIFL